MKKQLKELQLNKILISSLKGGITDPIDPDAHDISAASCDVHSAAMSHCCSSPSGVTSSSGRFTKPTTSN